MRAPFSDISLIGFYPTKKEQKHRCDGINCHHPIVYPSFNDIAIQLIFPPNYYDSSNSGNPKLVNAETDINTGVPVSASIEEIDTNNTGELCQFLLISQVKQPSEGCYFYLTIEINGKTWYSDVFRICNDPCYKITFWNNCPSSDYGYFGEFVENTGDYRHCIYLTDVNELSPSIDEVIIENPTTYGFSKIINSRTKHLQTLEFKSNNCLNRFLTQLNRYDNITIEDLESNCPFSMIPDTITVSGGGVRTFTSQITFATSERVKSNCCDSAYENEPFSDPCFDQNCDPPQFSIDCRGCDLVVNVQSGGEGYMYNWYLNGNLVFVGSTYPNAPSGSYTIVAMRDNCTDITTTFNHLAADAGSDKSITL